MYPLVLYKACKPAEMANLSAATVRLASPVPLFFMNPWTLLVSLPVLVSTIFLPAESPALQRTLTLTHTRGVLRNDEVV